MSFYRYHLRKYVEVWKPFWDKREGWVIPMPRKVLDFDPKTMKGWVSDYDKCNAQCRKLASRYAGVIAPNV
jgi:hypothetical protein